MSILSAAVLLFIILCALYFLAKINSENLGPFFRWSTYLILIIASGLLLLQLVRGSAKVWNRKTNRGIECCSGGSHNQGMQKSMNNIHRSGSCCCAQMDGDKRKMRKRNKRIKNEPGVVRESSIDTVDGKIIVKETEIIERKE